MKLSALRLPALLVVAAATHLLADDLYLRVIDVGQGERIVAKATDSTGPHYLNNGSSGKFIAAVHPTYVIFSAGHSSNYKHPSKYAAQRYLAAGVSVSHMFRTDLGDDEGPEEWDRGRIAGNHDGADDDDVEVKISSWGKLTVRYKPAAIP
jgi:hypothetical protein